MSPHIQVDLQRCTGCRTCEQVCAFAHEDMFGPARSRIRVLRRDVLTLEARVCTHCDEAYCVDACPTEALTSRGPALSLSKGNKTIFDPESCIGCGACVEVCDLLFWDEEREQPLICDLCGECVRRCPEGALQLIGKGTEEI